MKIVYENDFLESFQGEFLTKSENYAGNLQDEIIPQK